MWSDNKARTDFLNHTEVAELVCEMIDNRSLHPLSLGIFGGWGVGKSSILQFIRAIQESQGESIIVEFDAWLYQGYDEAKSALMTVISQRLVEETPETLSEKAHSLFRRANKLKVLGLVAEAGMAAAGMPTFGFASRTIESATDALTGEGDSGDVETLREGANEAQRRVSGLLADREIRSAPEEITAYKAEFSDLLKELDRTLVVFVDNLDRCLPKTAIQNLEAMRLFMSLPNTVFVIAADDEMIRHAVSQEFAGPSKKHVNDYLDKLIHFPISVPRTGLQQVQAYLTLLVLGQEKALTLEERDQIREHLLTKIGNSWADVTGITAQSIAEIVPLEEAVKSRIDTILRLAPLLAHSRAVLGNPRIIKRMMNVVSMRHSLAKRRGMSLDEAVITKLSLFERCTSEAAFADLLKLVHDAPNGKVAELSTSNLTSIEGASPAKVDSWDEHIPFIKQWALLAPDFGAIDLRPAVYLARETVPVQVRDAGLSAASIEAVTALLKVRSQTSQGAAKVASSIPVNERSPVMNELVASLKLDSDWSRKRGDLNGALVLAEAAPETRHILLEFLESVPSPLPWLSVSIERLQQDMI